MNPDNNNNEKKQDEPEILTVTLVREVGAAKEVRPGIVEITVRDETYEQKVEPKIPPRKKKEETTEEKELRVFREIAATKRLLRDYREIQKEPLPTVTAAPLESNIYEWHANILAVGDTLYSGMIFHFIMIFPENYPHSPPKISMENTIRHPNVFGSKLLIIIF